METPLPPHSTPTALKPPPLLTTQGWKKIPILLCRLLPPKPLCLTMIESLILLNPSRRKSTPSWIRTSLWLIVTNSFDHLSGPGKPLESCSTTSHQGYPRPQRCEHYTDLRNRKPPMPSRPASSRNHHHPLSTKAYPTSPYRYLGPESTQSTLCPSPYLLSK